MGLVEQVHAIIEKARGKGAETPSRLTATENAVVTLTAWCNGLQDAIAEVALQVEKLSSAQQEKPSPSDN